MNAHPIFLHDLAGCNFLNGKSDATMSVHLDSTNKLVTWKLVAPENAVHVRRRCIHVHVHRAWFPIIGRGVSYCPEYGNTAIWLVGLGCITYRTPLLSYSRHLHDSS